MLERLLRPLEFFAAAHPQAHSRGQIICFRSRCHAVRKRLPPKQALEGRWRFEEGESLRALFLGSFRIADHPEGGHTSQYKRFVGTNPTAQLITSALPVRTKPPVRRTLRVR